MTDSAAASAAPAAPTETSGTGFATLPTGAIPATPDGALAELQSFRSANSAALFDPSHKDHATASARHRALADAAFADAPTEGAASSNAPVDAAPSDPFAAAMADVPADANGYTIEPPHGLEVDPAFVGEMQGLALEMGLPAHVWKLASSEYMRMQSRGAFPSEDEISRMGEQSEAILRNAWGPEYDARLKAANSIIAALPAEKQAMVKQLLRVSGLGNDARMVMQFAQIADHRAQRAKR